MAQNDEITYADSSPAAVQLKSKEMDLESGWLGVAFGGSRTAPSNIAGLCLLLIVLPGIFLLFQAAPAVGSTAGMGAAEYWKIAAPIVTLILGYLFGKSA